MEKCVFPAKVHHIHNFIFLNSGKINSIWPLYGPLDDQIQWDLNTFCWWVLSHVRFMLHISWELVQCSRWFWRDVF
jgi:hypothetical protein